MSNHAYTVCKYLEQFVLILSSSEDDVNLNNSSEWINKEMRENKMLKLSSARNKINTEIGNGLSVVDLFDGTGCSNMTITDKCSEKAEFCKNRGFETVKEEFVSKKSMQSFAVALSLIQDKISNLLNRNTPAVALNSNYTVK